MVDSRAIGVFDSGLGGLTVLSAIQRALPHESTVYLGDTARVPYGTKSPQTVVRYALNNARALLSFAPLKMLVVACNTVDSVAHEALQDALSIPVIGVIEPGARAALRHGNVRSVGVLATAGTIASKAYEHTLRKNGFAGEIFSQACPLFVPLVEEGLVSGSIAEQAALHYLQHMPRHLDSIILGCTHYPMLLSLLKKTRPDQAHWIDSGQEVALAVKQELELRHLQAAPDQGVSRRYLVTDAPARFEQLSEFYLGKPVSPRNVELVDVGAGT